MNTNVKTNDAIVYSGSVHIQYRYGKKTRYINTHNEGKLPLFSAIVLALGDQTDSAKSYAPRFIMAKNNGGEDCLTSKLLVQDRKYYNSINMTTPVAGSAADTIRYTFVIPVANMYQNGQQITKLQLINELNHVCAEIDLKEGREINTDIGATLLIYWDLTFGDSSQSEE